MLEVYVGDFERKLAFLKVVLRRGQENWQEFRTEDLGCKIQNI